MSLHTVFAALVLTAVAATANAQSPDRRADWYVDRQREKAATPAASTETRGERLAALIERIGKPPIGWFPFIGSVYPSGWLAVGPGYRHPFDSGAAITGKAALSLRNFKSVDVEALVPPLFDGRIGIGIRAGWIDAPGLRYHGRGNETAAGVRDDFAYSPAVAGATARVAVTPVLTVEAGWHAEHYDVHARAASSALEPFDATLGATRVSASVDWRPAPGWAREGGALRVSWTDRRGLGASDTAFAQYEGEFIQLIPVVHGNWVVALRGLATMTAGDDEVPYFLLPSVGGSTSRAFADFRFRDRHRVAAAAELRWAPSMFLDLAVFVDAARVAATRHDITLDGMHTSVGVGARFHTWTSTVLRLEVAHGSEGPRLSVGVGPVF